ncbi:rckA, partial [Symbiodinium necroappetens]
AGTPQKRPPFSEILPLLDQVELPGVKARTSSTEPRAAPPPVSESSHTKPSLPKVAEELDAMMPVSDGMSDTTRAIYRRSPLHLTKGSWLDVPESVSVTSAAHRADINRAVHLIKGKVLDAPRGASRSCSDFSLRWQDSSDLGLPPSSGSQVEAVASDLRVPSAWEAGQAQPALGAQGEGGRAQVHRPQSAPTSLAAAVRATGRYALVAAAAGLALSRRRSEDSRSVARGAQELSRDASPNREALLQDLLTFSSVFMVVWVFIFPGSAWVGSSVQYDGWLRSIFEMFFSDLGPSSLLLKYNRFGSLLEWMHAVPGAVWCLLAPLQLVPECRAWLGEKHEDAGRLMLSAAAVLMVGFLLIDANHLTADRVDFATGGSLADAADAWSTSVATWLPPFNQGGMYVIAAWFVYTGIQTFRSGTAHAADHGSWALRHAASGLWVAAQRPMFAAVRVVQGMLGFGGSLAQADAFYCSAYVVTAAYIAFAEVAIRGRSEKALQPKWSFEKVPSLIPSPLERDRGLLGRSCAGKPPSMLRTEMSRMTSRSDATKFSALPWTGYMSGKLSEAATLTETARSEAADDECSSVGEGRCASHGPWPTRVAFEGPGRAMISVIMPCRNGWPFLPWAVDDLASSSTPLEILVCDDGSSDGSEKWLKALEAQSPQSQESQPEERIFLPERAEEQREEEQPEERGFVQQVPWPGEDGSTPTPAAVAAKLQSAGHRLVVLSSGGRGQGAAQNACLEAASSPLIGLMDADDRGDPERFARLLEALNKNPDWDGACSAVRIFGSVSEGMARYVQWQNSLLEPEELMLNRFVEIPGLHQSGLYPRSLLWQKLQGYRDLPGWPIDIDTWMRLAESGARIGKVPDELYGWRQHVLQSTRNHGRCGLERLRVCKAHFLLRSLPPQVRRLEIWSTGHTLNSWSETLQAQIHALAESENKEHASVTELLLVSWRPKGGRRGGAARRAPEGGGGAAARATVTTAAEDEAAEAQSTGSFRAQGEKRQRQTMEISVLTTERTTPPPPIPLESDSESEFVARVFAFGSEKLREKARQSIETGRGQGGCALAPRVSRWGRLDWPSA